MSTKRESTQVDSICSIDAVELRHVAGGVKTRSHMPKLGQPGEPDFKPVCDEGVLTRNGNVWSCQRTKLDTSRE